MKEALVRLNVVSTFRQYLGRYDDEFLAAVWTDVGVPSWTHALHHCGATALFVYHRCGLFLDKRWVIGKGFALVRPAIPLVKVANVEPGDLVWYKRGQHYAVVADTPSAGMLRIIQGNGEGKKVTETTRPAREVALAFSISDEIQRII